MHPFRNGNERTGRLISKKSELINEELFIYQLI
ncbi:Fic family protein [[Clostridium] scindens]|uniref:Fic family protein n=1 Tax=Clostridium scindens (strain JCM 10418 / VPI 12708) TaxID=29347 RepID=A0A844FC47_CLOSV|nr:hypothetical protein [[Clostridium] scindens]MBS5696298.1 hypothetical protein [Lachnospiraceae bacterium]MSS40384.1 Fic family protein [[Clostridium] scindens]NSI90251.1 Fic family protein [[Clostridium] scindens]NSJ04824.1 Fic family protein [[Clostridium] scindens]